MEYDVDLTKYHKVCARASFGFDVRNSTGLYRFIERYGTSSEDPRILIRRRDQPDTEATNPMSVMSTIVLAIEKTTELEILVDKSMDAKIAEEIKKFLENETNSAKGF